jgi:hypothetical protein
VDQAEQTRTERRGGLISRLRPGETKPLEGLDGLLREVKTYNPKADTKEIQRIFYEY